MSPCTFSQLFAYITNAATDISVCFHTHSMITSVKSIPPSRIMVQEVWGCLIVIKSPEIQRGYVNLHFYQCDIRAMLFKLSCANKSPGNLIKMQILI